MTIQRNEAWSTDVAMDALANGKRLKMLTIVDDCTKESIDLVADFSISGHYVTQILEQATRFSDRSLPAKCCISGANDNGVRLKLIQPGKLTN